MNESNDPTREERPAELTPVGGEAADTHAERTPAGTRSGVGRVAGLLKIALVFIAVGLLVVLTLQNTDAVTLNLLVWSVTLSLALFVFAVIVVGVIIGWVLRSMLDDDGFRPLG
ncbi:MAG: LapA family protein [Dehalococcoidia bacterium]